MNRRTFLALAAATAATAMPRAAMALPGQGARHQAARTLPAMGTLATVKCAAASQAQAEDAVAAAFQAMARYEKIHSRHDPASPLSQLNAQGKVDGPEELRQLVLRAKAASRLTDGAFNPAVLPLMGTVSAASPSPKDLRASAELCDPEMILVTPRTISLKRSGMGLTLDSIAKGRILDLAARAVESAGVRTYLIEAGGDILARTGPERTRPWRVALADPVPGTRPAMITEISSGALATSGGYETAFGPGKHLHHIVSQASLSCPNALAQATVFAPTAEEADALATAVFVMGPKQGMELIQALPGRECLLITQQGARLPSPGFNG